MSADYLGKNVSEPLRLFDEAPVIRDALFRYGTIRTMPPGAVIVNEGSYVRAIPIVLSGSVKVLQTDEAGHELLLYFIERGESCIMSFLGGLHCEKSKVKAVAEDHAELLMVPVDKVLQLMKEYPQWLQYIFHLYHKRFEELLQVVNAVAFTRTDERLWQLLQKKRALTGSPVLHVTHEQLARELGTARVVVSRLLKQLEHSGKVQLFRNRIAVL